MENERLHLSVSHLVAPGVFPPLELAFLASLFFAPEEQPFVKKALRMQAEMRRRAWWN